MTVPESIAELRALCQQGPNWQVHQPWGFRCMRKASIYLTWLLLHTSITANGVTLLGIVLAIAGGVLFAIGQFTAGAAAVFISAAADFSDGEVSRYRKQQSKQGSFLDKVYHFTAHSSVFAGLAIGAYRLHPSIGVMVLGFIVTVCVPAFSIVVGYGNELAVWKHARKLLERLNAALSASPPDRALLDSLVANASARAEVAGIESPAQPRLAQRVADLVGYWDFPYIFWTIIVAVVIHSVTGTFTVGATTFTAFDLVLVFYAVTYPAWIAMYLVHVLATRASERGYNDFSHELSMLLSKATQMARETSRR